MREEKQRKNKPEERRRGGEKKTKLEIRKECRIKEDKKKILVGFSKHGRKDRERQTEKVKTRGR